MWHHFNYEAAAEMRKKYIPLEKVLEVAELSPEDIVMDVGGGDGFYTLRFAELVRKVIYVDPSEPAAAMMRKQLKDAGENIDVLKEDICEMKLPSGVTKIFFSNSFHDIHCRNQLIESFSASSEGKLDFVLVEFKKDADIGPPPHVKLGPEELDKIFADHGYRHVRREILEKHYVTRYSKN